MNKIDTRGRLCPEPLIMTKRGIDTLDAHSAIEVVTDNATAKDNLMEYLTQMGIQFTVNQHDVEFTISFTTPEKGDTLPAEAFCKPASTSAYYAVVIKSRTMGSGSDDLGEILMRGFINSLGECGELPSHVILYNGGVQLAVNGSDTCKSLAELEARGVTILLCGTCVDFFGIKATIGVGVIGNMLKITQILTKS